MLGIIRDREECTMHSHRGCALHYARGYQKNRKQYKWHLSGGLQLSNPAKYLLIRNLKSSREKNF